MTGWVMVSPESYAAEADLAQWVKLAVTYTGTLPPK